MKTELMKRYENLTGREAVCEETEYATDDYLRWLEAQLTWRDAVKNPPEEDDWYLCKYEYRRIRFCDSVEFADGVWISDDKIIKYLPIPKE